MSKVDDFLVACQKNLGNWTCAFCASKSGQPAAIFREVKKMGYKFKEVSPGRWAKEEYCPSCKDYRTHYMLLAHDPVYDEKSRISIDRRTRDRILSLLEYRDAFTGARITSTPEIDHKIPFTRLDNDIDASILSNEEIKDHFQLLTREHNLLKDRMCMFCKLQNKRPPFWGVEFWYEGDERYEGSCEGCAWYDGARWRRELKDFVEEHSK